YVGPEAARGGPISLVDDGDQIAIDLHQRRLDLEVSPEELEKRRARYVPSAPNVTRGYLKFYSDHVGPAHEGATPPRPPGQGGCTRHDPNLQAVLAGGLSRQVLR